MASSLKEMVEREAQAAEAESPDEESEGEESEEASEVQVDEQADEEGDGEADEDVEGVAHGEAEPTPLDAIGEEEIKRAERAIAAQRKKLAGILGESYVAHDCVMCSGLGFVPELPPPGTEFALLIDEDGNPALAARPPVERPRVKAKDKTTCDWCEGDGLVDSGSNNPHAIVVGCTKCSGNGWVTIPVDSPPPVPTLVPVETTTSPNTAGMSPMPVDTWGRPWGHQHYGVPPASIPG